MRALHHFLLPEGHVHIAFSGGRTSAYMLHKVLEANNGLPNRARVVFTNTGREDPRTLDFVAEVGSRWRVEITWVQYTSSNPFYEIVNHNSAARAGEPFAAMIKHKRFTPNGRKRICTEQLKVRAARRSLVAMGWKSWVKALGIRHDEPHRHDQKPQPREAIWLPLVNAQVSKPNIAEFWRRQSFDLPSGVDSNCRLCFNFGLKLLADQMREDPADVFPEQMEALGFGTFKDRPWAELREFVTGQGVLFERPRRSVCGSAANEECFG